MKRSLCWTFVLSAVCVVAIAAQAVKVATVEDHDKAMKTIGATMGAVPKLLEAGNLAEAKTNYMTLRANFVGVQGFWADHKNADAQMLAGNAIAKIDAIVKAIDAADRPAVDAAVKELAPACGACHMKYREPDPNAPAGTRAFVIKAGVL